MRRLLLAVALCAAAVLTAQDSRAAVVSTSGPVRGEILAAAFSGDALVVARRPEGRVVGRRREARTLRVELRRPGQPATVLLNSAIKDTDAEVNLAASPEAVVVGLHEGDDDTGPSRVWVGLPSGPLREVAACSRSFLVPAVAVDGPRVAWADGGCAGGTGRALEVTPASVAFAGVDPAVPVRRTPVPADQVAVGVALRGDAGLVDVLRPTFFAFASDLRAFGPRGLGEVREREPFGFLLPVGLLPDGTAALARATFDDEGFEDRPDERGRPRCSAETVVLAPGATTRRPLQIGGCLTEATERGQIGATVAGDRVLSRVQPLVPRRRRSPTPVSITSVRADDTDLKTIVSGTFRAPLGLAADGGRVGWWQRRCAGGEELVVADGPVPALKACSLRVLTRRAGVRAGRISLRVRCPLGCTGRIVDDTQCGPEPLRSFVLAPGTRRLRVRVPRRSRARGRVLLRVDIDGGPTRRAVVRLRR
ncbi:MAG: hypothetical protein M3417_10935 [Actinomycetota bacterium]|nr:hypothetical protein [Actinomycetota bacterium]